MPYQRAPKITLNTNDETRFQLSFRLENTDVSVANAIRRTMIAEVPTMAITLVTVIDNTTALADEYIVHRLGLIPLHSENVDKYAFPQDCEECEGTCGKCAVQYVLKVECDQEVQVVTSRDLMFDGAVDGEAANVVPVHDSGDVEPKPAALVDVHERMRADRLSAGGGAGGKKGNDELNEGIVIVRMSKGQKIHMKALVRKAVELNLDRINLLFPPDAKKKLLDLSSGLLGIDEQSGNLKYEQPFLRGRIAVHPDTCRKAGELAVLCGGRAHEVVINNDEAKYYDFFAETTGAMTPRQALQMALQILEAKAGNVLAHLNT